MTLPALWLQMLRPNHWCGFCPETLSERERGRGGMDGRERDGGRGGEEERESV